MAWITPLIIGGSSLLSGAMGANASSNAATDMANASALSAATQLGMYNQTRTDLLPYMTSGNAALSQLDKLMGITPTASDTPQNTLGPITDAINAKAFGPAAPKESTLSKLEDPYGLFGNSKYGHQEAIDPIGYKLFGNSGFNPGHDVNKILGGIGLAKGGKAAGGKTYVVGERGPEILHMAPGSKGFVEPNSPKADAMAYGTGPAAHRFMGGDVGRYIGDPITMAPRMGVGYTPGTRLPQPRLPYSPILPMTPMPTHPYSPVFMNSPLRFSHLGEVDHRASGGPVEGFNPLGSNSDPLSAGGQTPNEIMAQAPEYQFVKQQGIEGLDQSAAASGNLLSGGHLKDILNYSQGLASEQYQNIFNNLQAVTSLGESAGAMVGNSGTYAGMGMGNSIMAGGNALASGAVGGANALNGAFGNLGFMYAMNPGMFGGGSGGKG